jgi:hypothetical protein
MAQMWKDTPEEEKAKFKKDAAKLQQEFKANYPNYAYRESKKKTRRAVTKRIIPPANSIFPAATWEVRWDQMTPFDGEKK